MNDKAKAPDPLRITIHWRRYDLNRLLHVIEYHLYRHGFTVAEARILMRNQLILAGVVCLIGLTLCWASKWAWSLAVGTILATINFYSLATFVQQVTFLPYEKKIVFKLLLRFYGRLFATGIVLYLLIILAKASVPALVVGLSTVVATIVVWGSTHSFEQRSIRRHNI
ncbi:membrane hypothetical protein [Desulfovibrionales bacterium]